MNNNFYHPELLQTPEGVRDIYGNECEDKNNIQETIHSVIRSYGFDDIQTPSFEYFDIFNKERGTVASNEMFKFFDRDNNTLVLRPDITPSIARSIAKYYEDEVLPVRLCYTGNTYINNHSHQGKFKEVTQVGAELINDDTSDADAEMIAMTIECLLKTGLREFQVDIGHAGFFGGLVESTGLNPVQVKELKELLTNKNVFAAEQYLSDKNVPENIKDLLIRLPEMFGNPEYISYAKEKCSNEEFLKAIERLEKIYKIIDSYGLIQYVNCDLGMISGYDYYTGIIFRAYTYGTGEPVATGGRYDSLLSQFGHDGAAIGVAICIDQLMIAMQRQKIVIGGKQAGNIILYIPDERMSAISVASQLRNAGIRISLIRKSSRRTLEDYKVYALRNRFEKIIFIKDPDNACIIYPEEERMENAKISDILKTEADI